MKYYAGTGVEHMCDVETRIKIKVLITKRVRLYNEDGTQRMIKAEI